MSRSKPVVLHNAVYDTHTRTLFTNSDAEYDLGFLCSPTAATCSSGLPTRPYPADLFDVNRPTYMTTYFHYCFAHAYMDFAIPLLSILDEIDPVALAAREFRLFMLSDNIFRAHDNLEEQKVLAEKDLKDYLQRKIDFAEGHYKGEMRHLHLCLSKYPILFEKGAPYRFYRFKTLILGGNIDNQRCIHNHASNYPDRFSGEPEASADQIHRWMDVARRRFAAYMGLSLEATPKPQKPYTIVLGRKENRTFLPKTMTRLEFELSEREIIDYGGIVYLEDLSLQEQIRLFQRTDCIITPHGSGLSHLLWSKPGTKVLEVFYTGERRVGIFPHYCAFLGMKSTTYIIHPEIQSSTDVSFDVNDGFWPCLENFLIME